MQFSNKRITGRFTVHFSCILRDGLEPNLYTWLQHTGKLLHVSSSSYFTGKKKSLLLLHTLNLNNEGQLLVPKSTDSLSCQARIQKYPETIIAPGSASAISSWNMSLSWAKAIQLAAHGPCLVCKGLTCGLQALPWTPLPTLLLLLLQQPGSLRQGSMACGGPVNFLLACGEEGGGLCSSGGFAWQVSWEPMLCAAWGLWPVQYVVRSHDSPVMGQSRIPDPSIHWHANPESKSNVAR